MAGNPGDTYPDPLPCVQILDDSTFSIHISRNKLHTSLSGTAFKSYTATARVSYFDKTVGLPLATFYMMPFWRANPQGVLVFLSSEVPSVTFR